MDSSQTRPSRPGERQPLIIASPHRLELDQNGRVTTFFARFTDTALRETQQWLLVEAAQIETPCRLSDYEPLLVEATSRLDPAMREALQSVLEEQLCFDEADPERVLGFGNTKLNQVVALLASQPHPIPVGQVFEALGRCRLPEEVLYFRRGVWASSSTFQIFSVGASSWCPLASR